MSTSFLKKIIVSVALVSVALATAWADIPEGYYSRISGEKKSELKTALKACINSGKKTLSYSSLWTYYEKTDIVPGTEKQVFDYYSDKVYNFTGSGSAPSGANKEHCCPQSWWGKGASCNCYSDLFNVMPSEQNANSAKSNYPVGIVDSDRAKYQNPRMMVGPSARKEYSGSVFEPCDEYKGDFARIYLYVAVCYDQAAWVSGSSSIPCAFRKESYPTIKPEFIQLLLQWNRQDPVSDWEVLRNERVFAHQGNRNPFIDYPQLADYIWGDSTNYAFDLKNAKVNGYGYNGNTYPTPDNEDDDDKPGIDPDEEDEDEKDKDDDKTITPSDTYLYETFADIKLGNNTENGGSSEVWSGNDNFPDVAVAYQAGGAVRIGTSKKTGSLTSRTFSTLGDKVIVKILLKGWTTVEGNLNVKLTGAATKTLSYTATIEDDFEEVTAVVDGVAKSATLTLSTTAKRCFIKSVAVYDANSSAIEQLTEAPAHTGLLFDLAGRGTSAHHKGLQIRQGKLIFVR